MASSLLLSSLTLHARRPLSKCSIQCHAQALVSASCHWTLSRQRTRDTVHLKNALFSGQVVHKFQPVASSSSEDAHLISEDSEKLKSDNTFEKWDSMTTKFAGAANLPFLLLQLPQIILNGQNLYSGNKSALLAVPWLGMLTGLLGNLSLLSYFIKKNETEAVIVQTSGVISTYIVMLQLAMGEAMPLPQFIAVSIVVATGLVFNLIKYLDSLNSGMWHFWEDFITVAGLSTLPQVMWSTFVPYLPNSTLPGIIFVAGAILGVLMARMGKMPDIGVKFLESASGWTATLLFMWMAVAQLWTNLLNPENIKGLSAISMLLAMIGNGLLIPRAVFIRDLMWFTGSTWGSVIYGWGNLICLYCLKCISREFFLATTLGFVAWIGLTFWRDSRAHGLGSPFTSFKELVFGP